MSAILVTGAAGFLGDAVCTELERLGHQVLPLDRLPRAVSGRATMICDLGDVHRMHALVRHETVSCIIHCGGVSGPMLARQDPLGIIRANIDGTANMLELARIHGIGRFIYCSSAGVYGATHGGPVRESDTLRPTDVYGASKAAGEHLVAAYAGQFGLDAVSLRFCWIYGPHRTTDCVIRTMLLDALARRSTVLPYGQGFPRQFVHIDDAARAVLAALHHPRPPQSSYSITGDSYLSLDLLANMVRQVFDDADIVLAEGPDPQDVVQHPFDITAARRDLDYDPNVTLGDGIRRYADWLRSKRVSENEAA